MFGTNDSKEEDSLLTHSEPAKIMQNSSPNAEISVAA